MAESQGPLLSSHFKKATLLDCNVNLKPADLALVVVNFGDQQ